MTKAGPRFFSAYSRSHDRLDHGLDGMWLERLVTDDGHTGLFYCGELVHITFRGHHQYGYGRLLAPVTNAIDQILAIDFRHVVVRDYLVKIFYR